jgi:hypothetical protein
MKQLDRILCVCVFANIALGIYILFFCQFTFAEITSFYLYHSNRFDVVQMWNQTNIYSKDLAVYQSVFFFGGCMALGLKCVLSAIVSIFCLFCIARKSIIAMLSFFLLIVCVWDCWNGFGLICGLNVQVKRLLAFFLLSGSADSYYVTYKTLALDCIKTFSIEQTCFNILTACSNLLSCLIVILLYAHLKAKREQFDL